MRAVLKIGGSLLYNDEGKLLVERVSDYATAIKSLVKNGHSLVVVVGGGIPARVFISAARELGANEAQCDWLGIKLARINAELLCAALGDIAYPNIVDSLDELEVAVKVGKVVLMGGLTPGQSTNAVAAVATEITKSEMLFNATNVDGVYDHDPDEPGATRFETIEITQLKEILSGGGSRAGEHRLFDSVAMRVVERSKISTVIFDGSIPENINRAFRGEKIGTRIIHNE
ncbi:UMP kinase [Candidatus Thorarchaeota archaeon]|nr:MAG: UMP kinase [Candidatus Thorarchaeota archaeon]